MKKSKIIKHQRLKRQNDKTMETFQTKLKVDLLGSVHALACGIELSVWRDGQTTFKFEIAKFMHQFTQNKLPSRFHHYFSHPSDIHTHSTRHSSTKNISLPRFSSAKTQRSINYMGAKIWNNIPLDLKQILCNKFKFSYKQLLLNQDK